MTKDLDDRNKEFEKLQNDQAETFRKLSAAEKHELENRKQTELYLEEKAVLEVQRKENVILIESLKKEIETAELKITTNFLAFQGAEERYTQLCQTHEGLVDMSYKRKFFTSHRNPSFVKKMNGFYHH